MRVRIDDRVHAREVQRVGQRQGEPVNLRAADDADLGHVTRGANARASEPTTVAPGSSQPRLPRHDDVEPSRQRPANRIPGLATHDDGLPSVSALKRLRSSGSLPGQLPFTADGAPFVRRDDDRRRAARARSGSAPGLAALALLRGAASCGRLARAFFRRLLALALRRRAARGRASCRGNSARRTGTGTACSSSGSSVLSQVSW